MTDNFPMITNVQERIEEIDERISLLKSEIEKLKLLRDAYMKMEGVEPIVGERRSNRDREFYKTVQKTILEVIDSHPTKPVGFYDILSGVTEKMKNVGTGNVRGGLRSLTTHGVLVNINLQHGRGAYQRVEEKKDKPNKEKWDKSWVN